MLCYSHRIMLLCPSRIMYFALVECWTYIYPYTIVLYWLHVQMIICFAIWSLWSFPYDFHVFDQVAHMFHNMFIFNHILLFTLYLSFYHLIYLEGLMCFVQVYQATSRYVPSATQLLNLGVSEFCHCSQTHI